MSRVADSSTSHFDISQLPSLKDGMTAEEEATKRKKTCRFIEEAGRKLKLPRVAVSSAMVFFHRFYAKHSFNEHDRFEVAVAAILLAAKTEESPKKLQTIILVCHKLKTRGMQAGRISQQGSNLSPAPTMSTTGEELDTQGEEYAKLKERILLLERVILHTIGFELSIDHPYKFFVDQIRKLVEKKQLKYITPRPGLPSDQLKRKMMNDLVQYCMSCANDSMHTSLCLQFSPELIATACVYLAAQFSNVEPVADGWKKILGDPDIESLASICTQILSLISERKSGDKDTFKKIQSQLDLLKSREDGGVPGRHPPPPPPSDQPSKRQRLE
eukprot:Nitzschia sp. Nitz4//scaffold48_size128905//34377//35363//NITZ4_003588-RA/size128905-processed-gene-0.75-mRNA-1//1//CDS//3329552946//7195//frame0